MNLGGAPKAIQAVAHKLRLDLVPLHSARVARNASDTLRERFLELSTRVLEPNADEDHSLAITAHRGTGTGHFFHHPALYFLSLVLWPELGVVCVDIGLD